MIHRRCVWIYHARLIIRKGKTGMKKGCPAGVWSGGKSRAGFISSRFLPAPCQSFCRRHVTQKMCLWIFFFTPLSFPRAFRSIAFPHQNVSQRRVKSSVWQDTLSFFLLFLFTVNISSFLFCVFTGCSSNMRRLLFSSGHGETRLVSKIV